MPLSEVIVDASMMVTATVDDVRTPVGTAFLVGLGSQLDGMGFGYAVTAAHVVRFLPRTYLRVSHHRGMQGDIPVTEWVFCGELDVAVTPMLLDRSLFRHGAIDIEKEIDPDRPRPRLGERVYFVGLLANIESMHSENVPMVRSGTIGRLYQEGVRVRWPDESVHSMTAHLLDVRSHQGFSGSPCWVQLDPDERPELVGKRNTYLLGLITGHLDEIGVDLKVHNTGVGLVTPVEDIYHVVMQEDLVAKREETVEKYRREHPKPEPAVMDSLTPEASSLDKTADLLGKLMEVPKDEARD